MQDSSSFKEWLENEKAKGTDGSVRQVYLVDILNLETK